MECPVRHKAVDIGFDVNVFRNPDRGGMDVSTCSEFCDGQGEVTCAKACARTSAAHEIFDREQGSHARELALIGPNVLG
jgi:hypothetical protein